MTKGRRPEPPTLAAAAGLDQAATWSAVLLTPDSAISFNF